MAERRMFSKSLLYSNRFMQLSKAAAYLYIYLCLSSDDDGFSDNADTVLRMCRCTHKHIQELVDGGWVILFENGVIAITHWHKHNQIKKDRYKATDFQKERAMLEKESTGAYVRMDPNGIRCGSGLDTQDRSEKESIEKFSIDQHRQGEDRKENTPAEPAVSSAAPPVAADDIHIDIDYDRILYYYQVMCKNLVPCEALTPKLRKLIADRVQDGYTQLRLCGVFQTAMMSEYLAGKNDRGWQASLEWLLDPMHIRDVESGKYTTWL